MKLLRKSKTSLHIIIALLAVISFSLYKLAVPLTASADTSTMQVAVDPIQPSSSIVIKWIATPGDTKSNANGVYAFALVDGNGQKVGGVTEGQVHNWAGVTQISSQSITISGLKPATTYNAQVVEYFANNNIRIPQPYDIGTVTTSAQDIAAFQLSASTVGTNVIAVSWSKITTASSYSIQYVSASGAKGLVNVSASATSYNIPGLIPSTLYYLIVTAYSQQTILAQAYGSQTTDTLGVTNLAVTARPAAQGGDTSIQVGWQKIIGAVRYTTGYSAGLQLGGAPSTNVGVVLSGLYQKTTYTITVTAYNAAGNAITSMTVKQSTDATPTGGGGIKPPVNCTPGSPNCLPSAVDPNPSGSAGRCGNAGSFFNLPTWYEYLKTSTDAAGNCQITKFCVLASNGCTSSSIPLVLLAVVDIALRIGALLAVGFVVFGGFKFVTSQGEPDGVKGARNTIINALVGLVVTIIAVPIVAYIGSQFGG